MQAAVPQIVSRAALLFVLLISACGISAAQGIELRVRVVLDNGRAAPQGIRVSLMTPVGSIIAQDYTNDNGEALFRVGPGLYRLKVTSPEIETAESVSSFQVQSLEEAHFEYMQVKPKAVDSGASKGSTQTVSTSELNLPDKAQQEFKKGTEALDHQDMDSARKHFEAAVSIFPQYSGAYNNLGIIAVRSGDLQKARSYFEKAVEADPSMPDASVNLSKLLFRDKQYKRIEQLLGKVAGVHPENAEVLMFLAQAELLDAQPSLALGHAQRVHLLPDHEQFSAAHIIAGTALQQLNRPQDALHEYEQFLKESPNAPAASQVKAAVESLRSQAAGGQKDPH